MALFAPVGLAPTFAALLPVADPVGIHFDSRSPSGLEQLLNYQELTRSQLDRGEQLLTLLRENKVSKYNVGVPEHFTPPADGRPLVLVVGQVDGDASILTGSPTIRSNEQLLWAVRAAKPEAHILYKPHRMWWRAIGPGPFLRPA